jgi:hypothetical protein
MGDDPGGQGLLYLGDLFGDGTTNVRNAFGGTGTTNTLLCGPDAPAFIPSIGSQLFGGLRTVTAAGSGTWLNLQVPNGVAGGTVHDTVCGNCAMGVFITSGREMSDPLWRLFPSLPSLVLLLLGAGRARPPAAHEGLVVPGVSATGHHADDLEAIAILQLCLGPFRTEERGAVVFDQSGGKRKTQFRDQCLHIRGVHPVFFAVEVQLHVARMA